VIKNKLFRPDWFVLVLLCYCLVIAALIGLSTPNVGTLSRYKTAFQPILVFLLLTGFRWQIIVPLASGGSKSTE
jgi:hypothetical protein